LRANRRKRMPGGPEPLATGTVLELAFRRDPGAPAGRLGLRSPREFRQIPANLVRRACCTFPTGLNQLGAPLQST
jgi:hypothetical protein